MIGNLDNWILIEQIVDYSAMVLGILYLILEICKKKSMWIVGFILSAAYIIISARERLLANAGLQTYYLIMCVYGWYQWRKDEDLENTSSKISIRKMPRTTLIYSILIFIVLSIFSYFVLSYWTTDSQPILDSVITSLSIVGTYWITKSYIEQWIVWMIVNPLYIWMYFAQGVKGLGILYCFYVLSAVYGYYYWKKKGVLIK
ncbi:MAG: nicotinamide riboside transporter PnuC [Bacteroidales bacterium]